MSPLPAGWGSLGTRFVRPPTLPRTGGGRNVGPRANRLRPRTDARRRVGADIVAPRHEAAGRAAAGAEVDAAATAAGEAVAEARLLGLLKEDHQRQEGRHDQERDEDEPEHGISLGCTQGCARGCAQRAAWRSAAGRSNEVVPRAGFEPARVAPVDFESTASTVP